MFRERRNHQGVEGRRNMKTWRRDTRIALRRNSEQQKAPRQESSPSARWSARNLPGGGLVEDDGTARGSAGWVNGEEDPRESAWASRDWRVSPSSYWASSPRPSRRLGLRCARHLALRSQRRRLPSVHSQRRNGDMAAEHERWAPTGRCEWTGAPGDQRPAGRCDVRLCRQRVRRAAGARARSRTCCRFG